MTDGCTNASPWLEGIEPTGLPGPEALPTRADVLVIGGGLAGAAVLAMLRARDTDAILLESRADVGLAASGRTLGHVTTGLIEHPYRLVHALGEERARAFFEFSVANHALLKEWVDYVPEGGLWAAMDQREQLQVSLSAEALQQFGIDAVLLDAAAVDAKTGGVGFGPAMWLPEDGLLNPVAAVRQLVRRAGGHAHVNCPVTAVGENADGAFARVGERTIQAELIVFAANAWCPAIDPVFEHKINPVREQALRFAPGGPTSSFAGRAGYGYTFWRQAPDGALLVGGCRWATPHMEVGESDEHHVVDRIQDRLETFAREHFPEAAKNRITHRWSWITAHTCDGLPLIGPLPGMPRMIACAGFGGNELGLGIRAARGVADGILEGRAHGVPDFLEASRFI